MGKDESTDRTVADAALTRSELTLQIGELAKAAKPTNIHAFTVLNVLAGALLISKEEEYAKAALAWMRYETTGESPPPSNTEGDELDKLGAMEGEIDRIVRACLDVVLVSRILLTRAESRLCLATVIRRLEEALWIDLKNDVLKEQISDARSHRSGASTE